MLSLDIELLEHSMGDILDILRDSRRHRLYSNRDRVIQGVCVSMATSYLIANIHDIRQLTPDQMNVEAGMISRYHRTDRFD